MSLETWMSKLDENTRLIDVAIPGTHQSLTYLCQSIEDWEKFTRTQTGTVIQQLDDGIRYLDMRLDYNCNWLGDDCDVVVLQGNIHCGRTVTNFQKIISDVGEWIRARPSEILILYISCEGNTAKRVCRDAIIGYLGNDLVRANSGITPGNTLKDIRQHGKVFIIAHKNEYQMDGVGNEFFGEDYLWSPFTNDSAIDVDVLTRFITKAYSNSSPTNPNALTCMPASAMYTSQNALNYDIMDNSQYLNPHLITNIINKVITPPKSRDKFNIIACDFYEYGNFNTFIIKLNPLNAPLTVNQSHNENYSYLMQNSSKNHLRILAIIGVIILICLILLFLYMKHNKY